MHAAAWAFEVGAVRCLALLDGVSRLDNARMLRRFPDATEADYRQAYRQLGLNYDEAASSLNVLLMRLGGETVLVDSGEGGKPHGGHLPRSLAQAGVHPAEVTLIVVTHSHGDHVQGLLNEHQQPAFPAARYVMNAAEWEWWAARTAADPAQRAIAAMMKGSGLQLIADREEILPGLQALPLPGHTPGHIGLRLTSYGAELLHLADLLHSPMQFVRPDWSAAFDHDKAAAATTRARALAEAADAGALVFFYHLAFPGLGRVARKGTAFWWEEAQRSA
jgi:glyoxylase-like metal-dependent hydrolase (beta-lactamase superfamily II)